MNTRIRALFRYVPHNRSLFNRLVLRNALRVRMYLKRATVWRRQTTGFPFYRWIACDVSHNWKGGRYLPLERDKAYQRFMINV